MADWRPFRFWWRKPKTEERSTKALAFFLPAHPDVILPFREP